MDLVILIGFPKSGTSSFQKLFKMLNYESLHQFYHENGKRYFLVDRVQKCIDNNEKSLSFIKTKNRNIFVSHISIFSGRYIFFELDNYKKLHEDYPNALYIILRRDTKKLIDSMKRWDNLDTRMKKSIKEDIKDDKEFENFILNKCLEWENYFSENGSKFIIFDIEKDNIEKLKKYIKIPEEIKCIPKENVNKKK